MQQGGETQTESYDIQEEIREVQAGARLFAECFSHYYTRPGEVMTAEESEIVAQCTEASLQLYQTVQGKIKDQITAIYKTDDEAEGGESDGSAKESEDEGDS